MRGLLRAFVLPATAFGMLTAGSLGALLPIALLQKIGLGVSVFEITFGVVGGVAGLAGAYTLGDRLNERVRRLRAPIGSAAIGADGIRWRHFGRTEFIAWKAVRDIEQRGNDVVFHGGVTEIVLHVKEADLFTQAARDALARYREGAPPETIASLEFAGDDAKAWLERARVLLTGASYRDANVDEEQCVRVAIDPRATREQRIGSAAALSKASEEARNRVRVAIDETADPNIANALEDALEERDDRVARMMKA